MWVLHTEKVCYAFEGQTLRREYEIVGEVLGEKKGSSGGGHGDSLFIYMYSVRANVGILSM